MTNQKIAVILFNLGGPDKKENIKPFLFNLFNDKAIISLPQPLRFLLAKLISTKREKTAQEIYAHLGDKSPILELTNSQADQLEKELSFIGDFKVFVAMRYAKPFARDLMPKIQDYNPDQIILLPLYPQFSTATSQSSIEDFIKEMARAKIKFNFEKIFNNFNFLDLLKPFNFLRKAKKIQHNPDFVDVKTICCYFEEENFILAHAKLLMQKIIESDCEIEELRILFSAHGLPQKIIDSGDPYAFQVEISAQKITEKLQELLEKDGIFGKNLAGKIDNKVCYQSKVGPLKWTSPSLEHEIKRCALDSKNPVIVPIAFVCEHSETLVELDIEYKELADELKIQKYLRVPALNVNGHFIKSLAKLCVNAANHDEVGIFYCGNKKRICPKKFKRCLTK